MVSAKSDEVDGSLRVADRGPWRADINYLYYNPQFAETKNAAGTPPSAESFLPRLAFADAALQVVLGAGAELRQGRGGSEQSRDTLTLDHGLIDTGKGRMSASGLWKQNAQEERSSLKGKLLGGKIDETAAFFGITIPLKGAPYDVDFDLYWHGAPWQPQVNTLSGALQVKMGKGRSTAWAAAAPVSCCDWSASTPCCASCSSISAIPSAKASTLTPSAALHG